MYPYLQLNKYECTRETMNFIWKGAKTTMVIVPSLYIYAWSKPSQEM